MEGHRSGEGERSPGKPRGGGGDEELPQMEPPLARAVGRVFSPLFW